jgi:putative membrane protein
MARSFRTTLTHFAQGLLMGGADIIPGVSGGTMALIVGIYEQLIASISDLFSAVVALLRADVSLMRTHLRQVAWSLILPLGLGIASALFVGAKIIPYFLEHYPVESRALFFGLIAGSLAIPWRRIGRLNLRLLLLALGGAVAAFFLVGLPPGSVEDPSLVQVFGAAALAICAMILPGVSGAFLLYVLGLYEPTLRALNALDVVYPRYWTGCSSTGTTRRWPPSWGSWPGRCAPSGPGRRPTARSSGPAPPTRC